MAPSFAQELIRLVRSREFETLSTHERADRIQEVARRHPLKISLKKKSPLDALMEVLESPEMEFLPPEEQDRRIEQAVMDALPKH